MSFALQSRIEMSQQLAQMKPLQPELPIGNTGASPEALRAVAQEFESLFMNMMMKSMRTANRTLSEGNYFNSFESKMYEDMLDEKLSGELSKTGGLGIADLLMRQFSGSSIEPRYDLDMGESAEVLPANRRSAFVSSEQFIEDLMPKAQNAAQSLGTKPEFIVAQAALETGWGQHVMFNGSGQNSHNLFGIKANDDWKGETLSIESLEVKDGVAEPVRSLFKVYESYDAAFDDYAKLLGDNDRYQSVTNTQTVDAFTAGLQKGGYATDPDYGLKVAGVLERMQSSPLALNRMGGR